MIDRRTMTGLLAGAGLAAATGIGGAETKPAGSGGVLKPKRLREGSRVGLVLPASMAFEASTIDRAKRQLEGIGFDVVLGDNVRARHGYFAGTDQQRAADVNRMFADSSIEAVYCYTGGWGCPRILPYLDWDAIRANPKVLIGYSDVTSLLNPVHQETGLVTFHGPVAASNIRPWTLEQLKRVLFSTEPIGVLENPPKDENELVDRDYRILTIREGTASGPIVGGNLTMLASQMGTPWEIETEGAILMLEDIHEAYYRIDRMLTQLEQGGKLAAAAGVVFGYCTDCPTDAPSFSLEEVLFGHFERLGVPAVAGLTFGHIRDQLTLPIGLDATLDATAGTLTFSEAAVV